MSFGSLPFVIHIADTFRWWSVPGGIVAARLLVPIVWSFGRMLLAAWLQNHGRIALAQRVGIAGSTAETIMPVSPRFWAMFAGLVFALSTIVAGTVIPLSRSGLLDNTLLMLLSQVGVLIGDPTLAWRVFLVPSWVGWSVACWIIALAFSPHPRWIAGASVCLWIAAFVATAQMGSTL